MINTITGKTADDLWLGIAEAFHGGTGVERHSGRGGNTAEMMHVGLCLENPRERWISSRTPAINVAFALAEMVWLITGRNDSGFLTFWNNKLSGFAGSSNSYHGAYGYRIRKHFNLDQLERAYQALDRNSDSRQVALQIWDPRADLPLDDGSPADADIPCNVLSMLKVRSGKLEWMQIVRSNDVFLGLPHNLVQFTTLQEVMAGWLQVDVGSYNQLSDSLHIYERDLPKVFNHQLAGSASNSDTFALPKEQSEKRFLELASKIEELTSSQLRPGDLNKLVGWGSAPIAFHNVLVVLIAEASRRRSWFREMDWAIGNCTNPVLLHLWNNWLMRVGTVSVRS